MDSNLVRKFAFLYLKLEVRTSLKFDKKFANFFGAKILPLKKISSFCHKNIFLETKIFWEKVLFKVFTNGNGCFFCKYDFFKKNVWLGSKFDSTRV